MLRLKCPPDKLIIKIIREEVKTDSGIILTTTRVSDEELPHDTLMGEVLYSGCPMSVRVGDKILFEQRFTCPVSLEGDNLKVIMYENILGVVDESPIVSTEEFEENPIKEAYKK